jgi:hypothetical protein
VFGALGEGGRLAGVRDKRKHSVMMMRGKTGVCGYRVVGGWARRRASGEMNKGRANSEAGRGC